MAEAAVTGIRRPDNVRRQFVKPGDMWRESIADGPLEWWVCDPDGNCGSLGGYDVYEHDNHMISVRGELVCQRSGKRWLLEQGAWTPVT